MLRFTFLECTKQTIAYWSGTLNTYNRLETIHPGPMLDNSNIKETKQVFVHRVWLFITGKKLLHMSYVCTCDGTSIICVCTYIQTHCEYIDVHIMHKYLYLCTLAQTMNLVLQCTIILICHIYIRFDDCCIGMWKPILYWVCQGIISKNFNDNIICSDFVDCSLRVERCWLIIGAEKLRT